MKTFLTIAISLAFATAAVRAQTAANYQSVISGQSPSYIFNFDSSSLSSVGNTATFTAHGTAGFASDAWGTANDAVSVSALTDYFSLTSPQIISGEGTSTAIGSMSMLFYMPATVPGTGYLFSGGDASPAFSLGMSTGNFYLKLKNKTQNALPVPTANTWYYFGLTYDCSSVSPGYGVNWYLGAVGGSLSTGFIQNGGTGGNLSATTAVGTANTFNLGNKVTGTTSIVGSEIDELATWTTALSSTQINSQFSALIVPVPEPSACILFGAGGLLVLWVRRTFRA
jgi:CheY-specific phosphatase CheX